MAQVKIILPSTFECSGQLKLTPAKDAMPPVVSFVPRAAANGRSQVIARFIVSGQDDACRHYEVQMSPKTGKLRLSELHAQDGTEDEGAEDAAD